MPKLKMSALDRLNRKSTPDANGCLCFTGFLRGGYGRISHNHRNFLAHRLAWELKYGPIPDGQCVLHKCDNPKCVNTDHLFLGTRIDNNADKVAKNRQSRSTGTRGEKRPLSKLTDMDIPKIRLDVRPQSQIAADYGVSQAVISRIKTWLSWSHIQ